MSAVIPGQEEGEKLAERLELLLERLHFDGSYGYGADIRQAADFLRKTTVRQEEGEWRVEEYRFGGWTRAWIVKCGEKEILRLPVQDWPVEHSDQQWRKAKNVSDAHNAAYMALIASFNALSLANEAKRQTIVAHNASLREKEEAKPNYEDSGAARVPSVWREADDLIICKLPGLEEFRISNDGAELLRDQLNIVVERLVAGKEEAP